MKSRLLLPAAMLAGATALTSPVHASVMLNSVTPDGSNFLYTYSADFSSDEAIRSGSKLVIVDFVGYVPGSITASMPNVIARVTKTAPRGIRRAHPGLKDDKNIPDLVFIFNGLQQRNHDLETFDFSGLSAVSTFGSTTPGTFGTVVVNRGEPRSFSLGDITVPSAAAAGAVPEPAVWAMMLVGLFGVGGVMRRSRDAADASPAGA